MPVYFVAYYPRFHRFSCFKVHAFGTAQECSIVPWETACWFGTSWKEAKAVQDVKMEELREAKKLDKHKEAARSRSRQRDATRPVAPAFASWAEAHS